MATFATWNPADLGANLTLSGGNLTATTSAAAWDSARSTISVSSGKWYWEYVFANINGTTIFGMSGIGLSTASINNFPGADANGWGYYGTTGHKFNNGDLGVYGATYTAGDTIGVALDMDGGSVVFYKNGASQGTAFTGLTGNMFAMAAVNGNTGAVTANFGASAFNQSVPSGFNPGLFTGTLGTGRDARNLTLLGVG